MDIMEFLRSTTPRLSRQEKRLLTKQKEKEERELRKQEKKRMREDKKLDKLISDRHKAKKHSFLPFSLKKVDSQVRLYHIDSWRNVLLTSLLFPQSLTSLLAIKESALCGILRSKLSNGRRRAS